jgi:AcrR family transcriptional regulator
VTDDQYSNPVNVQQSPENERTARGERILDAAAELVLRWGYKRVTIEDVAKLAGIGKGTVYLHWRTRESLFLAVLLRDSLALCDQIIDRMRADPSNVLPHRVMRAVFLGSMQRPLLAAMLTRDFEVLGSLVERGTADVEPSEDEALRNNRAYLDLLRQAGLIRTDLDPDSQLYLYQALINGYSLAQPLLPKSIDIPLPDKADALAHTFRMAFEPPGPPDPQALAAVAPRVIELHQSIRDLYAAVIHTTHHQGGTT